MKFKKWLKHLENKKIISKKPNPILPFLLAIATYALKTQTTEPIIQKTLLYLTIFTLIFAIIHLTVVITLKSKKD